MGGGGGNTVKFARNAIVRKLYMRLRADGREWH